LEPLEFEGTAGADYPFGNLHSTCVNPGTKEVILFGGKSNRYSNTTWLFNTETLKWKKIETKGTAPTPRYGHSAVFHEGKMIVFGGYDNEGKLY
jgi:N-acetylneuraminic acid mutarotase